MSAEAVHPDLAGQVALVTGGARGLGYSMASALARQGVDVALLDVLDTVEDAAAALAEQTGRRTAGFRCDVTDAASVDAAVDAASGALGRASVLLTAAGVAQWVDSDQVPPEQWRRVVDINLNGTFYACQAFARPLLAAGAPGVVMTVASMSAHIVNFPQHQASYNAAKAGVAHLTKSLAVEWAPRGIRVNAISPGYMNSDMTRQFMEDKPEIQAGWERLTPMGRIGEPPDLDGLVAFLASRSSEFITGQSIVIDGGYTCI